MSDEKVFPQSDYTPAGYKYNGGLTKRELFAAMAMQGLLAHSCQQAPNIEKEGDVASKSVLCADALIRALSRSEKEA